jgi:uncharacterized protein
MKIRSITLFTDVRPQFEESQLNRLGAVAQDAADAFATSGYEVQTIRLATNLLTHHARNQDIVETAMALEACCQDAGFEFVSLGPATDQNLRRLPEILKATQSSFATCQIVEPDSRTIDSERIRGAAYVIKQAAEIGAGFGNLRFAALANVRPGTPFFPAAYACARDTQPALAVATESADLAVAAATEGQTLAEAHRLLQEAIESHAQQVEATAAALSDKHALRFLGIDFSLAPFPGMKTSIGGALEALTARPVGSVGTLAAAATLTSAIQNADFRHVGFCGLMMPVLEDSILAQRSAEGYLRIPELLQWSAVCGTGLDTVPIPGDANQDTIANLLFDVAALAVRLDKPLTARLMPLPGKVAMDPVHFDFAYFADGGVLALGDRDANTSIATPNLTLATYKRSS